MKLRFDSKADKYITYNMQPLAAFKALTERFLNPTRNSPRVIVISGSPKIGRRYLVESSAFLATAEGRPTRVAKIDLSGFESERSAGIGIPELPQRRGPSELENFVHCLQAEYEEEGDSFLVELLKSLKLNVKATPIPSWSALVVSMSMDVGGTVDRRIRRIHEILAAPPENPIEAFYEFVREAAGNGTIVLHVVDDRLLDDVLRSWLFDLARSEPNVVLAFSALPQEEPELRSWDKAPMCVELAPPTMKTLRDVMGERFSPNRFPPELFHALIRYSDGMPSGIARKLLAVIRSKAIKQRGGQGWIIAGEGPVDEAIGPAFSDAFYEPIRLLRTKVPQGTFSRLNSFLELAALCGDQIPSNLLTRFLEMDDSAHGDFIELLDTELIEGCSPPILVDRGFSHSGFPDVAMYGFADAMLPFAIRKRIDESDQKDLATRFLRFLDKQIQVTTRGVARLLLELARHADQEALQEELRQKLAWWIDRDQAGAFEELLVDDMKRHCLSPQLLWLAITNEKVPIGAYTLLAVLNAYERQPDGMPLDERDRFFMRRATALFQLGRYPEADQPCRQAVNIRRGTQGEDAMGMLDSRSLLGRIEYETGRLSEAKSTFLDVLERMERVHPNAYHRLATCHSTLAMILLDLGDPPEAWLRIERAIKIAEKHFPPDHPEFVIYYSNLAVILKNLGCLTEARGRIERAIEIGEIHFTPYHPKLTIYYSNLAVILKDLGNLTESRRLTERILKIEEEYLAPNHPILATRYHNLGIIVSIEGNPTEALALEEKALSILLEHFDEDHQHVKSSRKFLAEYRSAVK